MKNIIENFKYYLLLLLVFLISLQSSSFGLEKNVYDELRTMIICAIVILFIVNLNAHLLIIKKIKIIKLHVTLLLFFSFILFIIYLFGVQVSLNVSRDIFIALIILLIGFNLNLSNKRFNALVTTYIILITVAALTVVFNNSIGFIIQENYLKVPKNQLAPIYGVGLILAFYYVNKQKRVMKIIYLTSTLLLFASILVIRGRAVIVALFLCMFIFTLFYLKGFKYKLLVISLFVVLTPFFYDFIFDALFLNYDISDVDSISTGRMERNILGLFFIKENPLFGQLMTNFEGGTIHNFILINMVSYGIILSPFIITIYLGYIIESIRGVKKNRFANYEVAPLIMIMLIIVSFFEYTYPFAPGSAVFLPFMLFGNYLRKEHTKSVITDLIVNRIKRV